MSSAHDYQVCLQHPDKHPVFCRTLVPGPLEAIDMAFEYWHERIQTVPLCQFLAACGCMSGRPGMRLWLRPATQQAWDEVHLAVVEHEGRRKLYCTMFRAGGPITGLGFIELELTWEDSNG